MRFLRGWILSALLFAALVPEFRRYTPTFFGTRSGEHGLRAATEALRVIVTRPQEVPDPGGALSRIVGVAHSVGEMLPGDARPWILAGSARLVAGDPRAALDEYRRALTLGERAEIDLNVGRAYEALGDRPKSLAAFRRAVWISPALLSAVLPDVAVPLRDDLARLEADLKAGRLRAPPPLP